MLASPARTIRRELQALIRRQLPAITQRLSATLDKLQRPGDGESQQVPLREWWEALARQYQGQDVEFTRRRPGAGHARAEGAVRQRRRQPAAERASPSAPRGAAVRIRVSIQCGNGAGTARARQRPRGAAGRRGQPFARAGALARAGLASACTRPRATPKKSGYALTLAENRDGAVCFTLAPGAAGLTSGQDAGGDQLAVELADRDPGELVVEFAVGGAVLGVGV